MFRTAQTYRLIWYNVRVFIFSVIFARKQMNRWFEFINIHRPILNLDAADNGNLVYFWSFFHFHLKKTTLINLNMRLDCILLRASRNIDMICKNTSIFCLNILVLTCNFGICRYLRISVWQTRVSSPRLKQMLLNYKYNIW